MSYEQTCGDCGQTISAAANYCPFCGAPTDPQVRTDGGHSSSETKRLGLQRTECWRCDYDRLIFESCPECGGSCKPLKAEKQRKEDANTDDGREVRTDGGPVADTLKRAGAFPYPGSKGQLAGWIIDHLPDHHCYVEPFGGSAAVLLQKPASTVEVVNDRDGDIVHFYQVLRDRESELLDWLKTTPFSRDLHRKYAHQYFAGYRPDDDVERAGRWFYLRNTQFAQKYTCFSGFRLSQARNHASTYQKRVDKLRLVADRLRDVQVANRDYVDLVERTDAEDTCYYFDPPYVDVGDDLYSHEDAFDHSRFTDVLESIEGDWIVSYTDLPDSLEGDYYVVERSARGTMRAGQGGWTQRNTERLVMNFDPECTPGFVDDDTRQETLLAVTDGGDDR